MTTSILSNINLDLLKGRFADASFADYDQVMVELTNPASDFNAGQWSSVLIFVEGEALRRPGRLDPAALLSDVRAQLDAFLLALTSQLKGRSQTRFCVTNLSFCPSQGSTYLETLHPEQGLNAVAREHNARLSELAQEFSNLWILDFDRLVRLYGWRQMTDPKYWYLGRIRLSALGHEKLGDEFERLTRAGQGKAKKVIAVDLDNTLWGGVLGEGGWQELTLGEEGLGKAFRDFQFALLQMQRLGVLLVCVSKNDHDDAIDAMKSNDMMILKPEDFASFRINWQPKPENLAAIADELGLGLDSFVFIDDNPVERQQVKEAIPEVSVPDFPKDATALCDWFNEEVAYDHFAKLKLTAEDQQKTEQYQRRAKRHSAQVTMNYGEFLASLAIDVKVMRNPKELVPRLAQLSQKTNQFNMTMERYTESQIGDFMGRADHDVYALEYQDRFGKEGVCGEVIVKRQEDRSAASIELFLMSCRIIGRRVEYQLLDQIIDDLIARDIAQVAGHYVAGKRNHIVKDFLEKAGLNDGPVSCLEVQRRLKEHLAGE